MRISREELDGLAFVSEGYKVFNNDWTAKHNNYCYADEEGRVVGTIHRQKDILKNVNMASFIVKNLWTVWNIIT